MVKKDDKKSELSTEKHGIPEANQTESQAPKYEKPRVRVYAPLHELTFTTGTGATGVGIITSVSGGGM